jgi:hypothetical protein
MATTVYVYHDEDYGEIEIFSTLARAKKFADKMRPAQDGEEWEQECSDQLRRGMYSTILTRKMDTKP